VIRIGSGKTRRRFGLGAVALVGAVVAVVFAASGSAGPPQAGSSCQPSGGTTGGKIEGRGATFQFVAQMTWINGFRDDECGPVGSDVGSKEVIYNDAFNISGTGSTQGPSGLTGSGKGQQAASCRTDAYSGSDIPYDTNTLGQLNGAVGAVPGSCAAFAAYNPLFPPSGGYPNGSDTGSVQVMSFPVAISSIVVGMFFGGTAGCPTPTTAVNLSKQDVADIFGGNKTNWNQIADSPPLTTCNLPIRRVVRFDNSGTTQNFKGFLANVDPSRTGEACDNTRTWSALYLAVPNTAWPGDATGNAANCSTIVTGVTNGGPELLNKCVGVGDGGTPVPGSVCYADAADVKANSAYDTVLTKAFVRNGLNTSFQGPFGAGAGTVNCSQTIVLPSTSPIGLDPTDSWAFDQPNGLAPAPNHANITNAGSQYPICGMTWDLVYTGIGEGTAGTDQPISRLTDNQRRTLYSYMSYILSKEGQDLLTTHFYQRISQSTIDTLRTQFQQNYDVASITP